MDVTVRRGLLATVLVLGACGGTGERACDLLEDLPDRAGQVTMEQVQDVAEAAIESERTEIREIGQEMRMNLTRRRVLENLAPGSFVEVIQANLDALRNACRELETSEEGQ